MKEYLRRLGREQVHSKHSSEIKKRISESNKGKHFWTEEMKKNLRQKNLGRRLSAEARKKISVRRKGFKHTAETIAILKDRCGEKNSRWNPNRDQVESEYNGQFKNRLFRNCILDEQKGRCLVCGEKLVFDPFYRTHLHHIDFNKRNNDRGNLSFCCHSCHGKIENDTDDIAHIQCLNNQLLEEVNEGKRN